MFTLDEKRCNACFRKLENARAKRQEKRATNVLGKRKSDEAKTEKWYVLLPITKIMRETDLEKITTSK